MKARVLCLFMTVALAFLPLIAMAEITTTDIIIPTYSDPVLTTNTTPPPTPPPTVGSYSTDIKIYGDQSASHSIGTLTVDSYETGHTDFTNDTTTFKGTLDVMKSGPCDGEGCSFGVVQGDFTAGSGHEYGYTDTATNIDITNYTGSVDMSSFGGIAVCTTADPAAYGSFNQNQYVNQTVIGANGGTSNYSGSQTLNLTSRDYTP